MIPGNPVWTVSRPCPAKIKMEGKWGWYWMLVTGHVGALTWEVGCGERFLAGRGRNDPYVTSLMEAQTLAEEAVMRCLEFDAYDPNARWKESP